MFEGQRKFQPVRAGGRGRSCIRSGLLPKTDLSGGHVACMALRSGDTDVTDPWRSGGRILESDVDTRWGPSKKRGWSPSARTYVRA
eukprot:4512385-Prymnesium_polylepis.1